MQAYEFYAKLENGFIRVPEKYGSIIKSDVKVILLEEQAAKLNDKVISRRTDLLSPISIDTRGWKFNKEVANDKRI